MLVFATVVPVGIALGMIIAHATGVQSVLGSILGAYAAGSFLYVALLGMVVEEFSSFDNLWRKFCLVMGSVLLMGLISVISEVLL